jgi:hypothetical protein
MTTFGSGRASSDFSKATAFVHMELLTYRTPLIVSTYSNRCTTPVKVVATLRMGSMPTPKAVAIAAAAMIFSKLCAPGSLTSATLQTSLNISANVSLISWAM